MTKLLTFDKAFKNSKTLQYAIDNPEKVMGFYEFLRDTEEREIENYLESFYSDPSWLSYYNIDKYIKDTIEDPEDIDNNLRFDYGIEQYLLFEHVNGYHLSYKIGDTKQVKQLDSSTVIASGLSINDIEDMEREFVFIGTAGNLNEEIEIQANNGGLAYYYTGPHFFEIWLDRRFYISKDQEDK